MLNTQTLRKLSPSFLHRAVHHPDPLTRHQIQRFLDAVTTSFRKNLDQEHGWPTEEERSSTFARSESQQHSPTPLSDTQQNVAGILSGEGGGVRHRPTDHHLSSILSSPLFRPPPNAMIKQRDPMGVFDQAVSKGLMTIPIATGCLKSVREITNLSRGTSPDVPTSANAMGLSGLDVCDRVLGWLESSGLANNTLQFARYYGFVSAFVPFLVAEGKEIIIWNWLSALMTCSEPYSEEGLTAAKKMLHVLINSKSTGPECVDGAFESIIEASETYRDHPQHEELLIKAWRHLAWNTTSLARQKPPASASLFDAYLDLADYIRPKFTRLPVAHLHLHHPKTPTHEKALQYFNFGWTRRRKSCAPSTLRREAVMGLDAVNHLGIIGELEEAESLMSFIHDKYPFIFHEPDVNDGNELLDHLEPKPT